jgi:hypothetical protein
MIKTIGLGIIVVLLAAWLAAFIWLPTDYIEFRSEPGGATVRTSLHHICVAPCSIMVRRGVDFTATFSAPAFMDQTIAVRSVLPPSAVTRLEAVHEPNPVIAVMRPSVTNGHSEK